MADDPLIQPETPLNTGTVSAIMSARSKTTIPSAKSSISELLAPDEIIEEAQVCFSYKKALDSLIHVIH